MIKVYYLYSTEFGPDLCNMRYIGQTNQRLSKRLWAHINSALKNKSKTHLYNWIRSVYAKGFEVKVVLLVDNAIYHITEIEQIKRYRELGYELTNDTDGGEGCLNPVKETRDKMSIAKKGKPAAFVCNLQGFISVYGQELGSQRYEEFCRSVGSKSKGRKWTEESKNKKRGTKFSLEHKQNITNGLKKAYAEGRR